MSTPHLGSLGAREIPRPLFVRLVAEAGAQPPVPSPWRFDPPLE
jgi:Leu/Phe-tRNA-protein transferase